MLHRPLCGYSVTYLVSNSGLLSSVELVFLIALILAEKQHFTLVALNFDLLL